MPTRAALSRRAYGYLYAVIAAGLVAVAYSIVQIVLYPVSNQWMVLAGLTLLTGSFSVKIPSIAARISVSEAFVFACVLMFGPSAATVTVALDSLVMSLWQKPDERYRLRSAFNFSAVAFSIWIASTVFLWLAGATPGQFTQLLPLESHLGELFVLAGLYFILNSGLVAGALSFEKRVSPLRVWWEHFPWFSINYFGGVSVAALLVSYTRAVDLGTVGIIVPLLLISYLTYKTSLGRIADAKRHVDQVNELYMSTIETLAMAVDAKDQITHGHIRRVQVYAIELARRVGVNDDNHIRAIEAAALLHDVGKLAIPEHILNKPGPLTAAEFEKIKRHTDIGADLLSSIRFPYPVVPIVRHHHEHWDGSGYPTGISGTDIPLGARILSVVDCFDALTSDRPYRPRLTTADAFVILKQRRGSMYDPLIVDTFVEAYAAIGPAAVQAGQLAKSLVTADLYAAQQIDTPTVSSLREIHLNASQAAALAEARRAIEAADSTDKAIAAAYRYSRQLTPANIGAFFENTDAEDSLTCTRSFGDSHQVLLGMTIRLGERITGWAVANKRTAANSDAVLDLGPLADVFQPPLRTAVSCPLDTANGVTYAYTAYCSRVEGFSLGHVHALEQLANSLASRLSASRRADVRPISRRV